MRGFMVVLLACWVMSVGAAGRGMAGLLQEEGGDQCNDEGHAEQIEGVAEGEDIGLLLHDMADRNIGTMRCVRTVEDAVIDEVLSELFQPRPRRLLEHRD